MKARMFYFQDAAGAVQGPVTPGALLDLWRQGAVCDETPTALDGDEDWLPLTTFWDVLQPPRAVQRAAPVRAADAGGGKSAGDISWTQAAGVVMVLAGVLLGFYYFVFFDTATASGVHNVGLMNDRMAGLLVAGVLFIGGLIAWAAGRRR